MVHKYPKGRPNKDRMSIDEVNRSMLVEISASQPEPPSLSPDDVDPPVSDYLESMQFSGKERDETYEKSILPVDGIYGKNVLTEEATNHRQILQEFGTDVTRILLGAAWVDEDAWREFIRYPKCLFVDTTHGTNNES